jgi:hypothetical protein
MDSIMVFETVGSGSIPDSSALRGYSIRVVSWSPKSRVSVRIRVAPLSLLAKLNKYGRMM